MHYCRPLTAAMMMRRIACVMGFALLPAPVVAQYIGGEAPPLPAPLRPGEIQTPTGSLTRALRTLAQSPRDFGALITAGRAALELGDTQAAIGFFGRAEELRPSDPAPKIGMGAATVVTGDASGALRWFFEAQSLGATSVTLGADRGLAQDLLGNQASAQVDYRAALAGREADEARRRLALSLGISGDRAGAFATLQPLVARRDPAVQRIRAFVLALVGDERGASGAIDQAMPGSGSRMAGFFRLLPSLSASQKAAAVHLGLFPDPSEIRVAAVSPRIIAALPTQREARKAPPVSRPQASILVPTPKPAFSQPPRVADARLKDQAAPATFGLKPILSSPQPSSEPPASVPWRPTLEIIAPASLPELKTEVARADVLLDLPSPVTTVREVPPPLDNFLLSEPASVPDLTAKAGTVAGPAEGLSPLIVPVSGDRLSGIDRLLAQADELPVPPAPKPRVGKAKPTSVETTIKKATDLKKASEGKKALDTRKAEVAKKAADAKAEREALGIAGSNWVQLAGGSNADRMGIEFRRLAVKSAALKKRGGVVTAGKDYFRLLTGPFATRADAQAFVNQLAKDGVDGFSWSRTPATLKIEKLAPK